ncbi:hypothetical protein [Streptomyces sp. NPDC054837]
MQQAPAVVAQRIVITAHDKARGLAARASVTTVASDVALPFGWDTPPPGFGLPVSPS